MQLTFHIYETPFTHDKRFGFEWSSKTYSGCPFGRYERNRWCRTGIRIYYGSKTKHLTIMWDDSFQWCPIKKNACDTPF